MKAVSTYLGRGLSGNQAVLLQGPVNGCMLLEVLQRIRRAAECITHSAELDLVARKVAKSRAPV